MSNKNLRKRHKQQGATSVEYALMVTLIAAFIVVTVTALGAATNALFAGILPAIS